MSAALQDIWSSTSSPRPTPNGRPRRPPQRFALSWLLQNGWRVNGCQGATNNHRLGIWMQSQLKRGPGAHPVVGYGCALVCVEPPEFRATFVRPKGYCSTDTNLSEGNCG